ncbi:VOC family protein [Litoribacter alkaliphilus]|uniref:VOC family protein n=1 Tax=Litoribacter ruber TaxID=702568 RepID=A0AAP2G2I8_9BACT|nr:VOC family protein [Litoribacter alkaliphilus]MBS9525817.1 VOC family protein [Litoribacter alkaliphilus]
MAAVSTYLNFARETEQAFNFYKEVFGNDFIEGIHRYGDMPPSEGAPPIAEEDKHLIMNMTLPIVGGHLLMGTDAPESMGFKLNTGNNVHISLHVDSKEEARKYFDSLSSGGEVSMELQDMFWGEHYGSCTDKFGIQWMFHAPIE